MDINQILSCHKDNEENFAELSKLCCNREIIPFVGAGMSQPIYKGWADTLKGLLDYDSDELSRLLENYEYQKAADFVYKELGIDRFEKRFFNLYDNPQTKYTRNTDLIAMIFKNVAVVTTNYDQCLENAYKDNEVEYDKEYPTSVERVNETVDKLLRPSKTLIWKLHGDYNNRTSRVFTSKEYEAAYSYSKNRQRYNQIKRFFMDSSFLFLGCSLTESDNYVKMLEHVTTKTKRTVNYAFFQEPSDKSQLREKERFFSNHGIRPIWYPSNDDTHESVTILLEQLRLNFYAKRFLRRSITSDTFTSDKYFVPKAVALHIKEMGFDVKLPDSEEYTLDDIIAICLSKKTSLSREGLERDLYTTLGELYDSKYRERTFKNDVRGKRPGWKEAFNNCLTQLGISNDQYHQSSVIVVGIGNGKESAAFEYNEVAKNKKGELCLVDIASGSLSDARDWIFSKGGNCTILQQPAQDLSMVPSDSQDIYISTMTYQSTFFNIDKALYEAVRVLKPDGSIIISITNGIMEDENDCKKGIYKFNSNIMDVDKPRNITNKIKRKLEFLGFEIRLDCECPSEIFICGKRVK